MTDELFIMKKILAQHILGALTLLKMLIVEMV
jgi:hypothetical protein